MSNISLFLDSDVLLDYLLIRKPFEKEITLLISKCEQREIDCYTTSIVVANVYYIASKVVPKKIILENIKILLSCVDIITTDKEVILDSIGSKFSDYEDALQNFSAIQAKIDCVVTRNTRDYKNSTLQVFTSEEILAQLDQ